MELQYLPLDDDNNLEVKQFRPEELGLKYEGLLKEALALTGRTYVRPAEVPKWKRIDRLLVQDMLDPAWIQEKLDWASENSGITFVMVTKAILNSAAFDDWLRRRSGKSQKR